MPKRHVIWIVALVIAAAAVIVAMRDDLRPLGMARPGVLTEVTDLIEANYLWDRPRSELQEDAIRALVDSLDPYSHYLPAAQGRQLAHHLAGRDGGTGLELVAQDGQWVVVAPRYLSPAYQAGVMPADIIVSVNGEPAGDMPLDELHAAICPADGQEVELVVRRDGQLQDPIRMQCGRYDVDSVTGLYRDAQGYWVYRFAPEQSLAYVAITEITDRTEPQLREALRKINSVDWLILDLRGNPGGPMPVGVSLANMFFDSGPIVYVTERNGSRTYAARGDVVVPESTRLIVLVNSATASAAEVLAGALQHRQRAVLVGEATEGKRYIQHLYDLPDGLGQLSLTTGYYHFEPFDAEDDAPTIPIQALSEPLSPEIVVQIGHDQEDTRLRFMQCRALPLGYGRPAEPARPPEALVRESVEECLIRDTQLGGAIWLTRVPEIYDVLLSGRELESLSIQVMPDDDVMEYLGYQTDDANSGN